MWPTVDSVLEAFYTEPWDKPCAVTVSVPGGSASLAGHIETLTPRRKLRASMSDDAVSPETVRHVAALARVDLDDDEVDRFADQFADILSYFETLDEVPDVDREADLANVMRPDERRPSLDRDRALENAPETEDGYFKGPNVS